MRLNIEEEPRDADLRKVLDGLLADHAAKGHIRSQHKLAVFLRDAENQVWGGIIGSTYWGHLVIDKLWVEESLRGHGYGKKLLQAAEDEALRRGCRYAHTDTFTWQNLPFYQKFGYEEYAVLKDFPAGNSLHYIVKKLIPGEDEGQG